MQIKKVAAFILVCAIGIGFMAISEWHGGLIKAVEMRSGVVSELKTAVTEYVNPEKPTHDDSPIYYTRMYQAQFKLDNQAIEAVFSKPMQIQNGDQLRVSGYSNDAQFTVLAYWNQSSERRGSENWLALAIGGLFFLGIALFLLNSTRVEIEAPISTIFLLGFAGIGFYMLYKALLIRQALQLLNTLQ